MPFTRTTRDHDEIRRWAESRGAIPSEVSSTRASREPGILRFQFPGAANRNDSALREISWEDFFQKFDESNLELLYQDQTAGGQTSNFNKLIHPESAHRKTRGARKRSTSARSARKRSSADALRNRTP